ncbi:MAG: lipopolysaccharide core heptose(I) kinase RfaP [Pseudomonadota bacterium]|nr:lipopolysaccharide core heptose(I) kinase RfaP [Pseudomonadota bacterium]MBU1397907.1 lipopolysaccharide core heptose(I) kinase RfaP [Pseudomonadota bacterium]MBU1570966.1 lipopolysaccharide core heptose(I) kinase RfaP [Pseudomonadota bacterium]
MIVVPEEWANRFKGRDIFDSLFAIDGKVYRNKEGRKTLRFTIDGKNYFGKFHSGIGWKTLLKNLIQFRTPVLGARNEWMAIRRLEQLGIHTMRLVGYGKRGKNPARVQSFVITEELKNTISLEEFCRSWTKTPPSYSLKKALITKVAETARTLHENGINHRDLYICHFLLDITSGIDHIDNKNPVLYLIDLHRVKFHSNTPVRWRIKDVAALYFSSMDTGLTNRDLLRFIRAYSNKEIKAALNEKKFWQKVKSRGNSFYSEFKRKYPTAIINFDRES